MIDDNFIDVSEEIDARIYKEFNIIEGSFRELYHNDVKIGVIAGGEVKLEHSDYIFTTELEDEDNRIRIYKKRVF
jgi:hypothetical protein